jgi:hypothetical protein
VQRRGGPSKEGSMTLVVLALFLVVTAAAAWLSIEISGRL